MAGVIQLGVPAYEYHEKKLGVVSKSALDEIARSPMHYRAWVDGVEKEPTPALVFGQAFHCALLEPAVFSATYAIEPDFGDCRFKAAKTARDEWRESHQTHVRLNEEDGARIKGMIASINAHPAASRLLAEGESEVTLRWTDEQTGLACKARADYWVKSKRMVVDAKSTGDASPDGFVRSAASFGYHRQSAFYAEAFAACEHPIQHFALLAVEKEAPHACAVYVFDGGAVAVGHASIRSDIHTLQSCLESGVWPGYSSGVETLSLPPWVTR